MSEKHFDVIIIGGGVSGSALFYELSNYTNIKSIALLEKYGNLAELSSCGKGNSQTIHSGDIETNYTLDKAKVVKRTANMIVKYCLKYDFQDKFMFANQKMAVGIGDTEVDFMLNRHEEFKELYPHLEVYDKEKLKEIEPRVVAALNGGDRPENIVGVGAKNHYTTIDYQAMSKSLAEKALCNNNKKCEIFLNTKVAEIKKLGQVHVLRTASGDIFTADFVVVNAGGHSLYLAHKMGYGEDYGCVTVGGSYYMANKKILNGKVYMVQNSKLPFAALHGDPDILMEGKTRFGPTALFMPKLERYKGLGTVPEFFRSLNFDTKVAKIFKDLLLDKTIRNYVFRNFLYELPYFNKQIFLNDIRKLIPSLGLDEIVYAKGFGGIRPQVMDKKNRKLMLGEATINPGTGILFNMTPSPGATSCLGNAERDSKLVCDYLGATFNQQQFDNDFID